MEAYERLSDNVCVIRGVARTEAAMRWEADTKRIT